MICISFIILTMLLACSFASLQFCVESSRYIHLSYVICLLNPILAQVSIENNYILCWEICHNPKNTFPYSYMFCIVLMELEFDSTMFSFLLHMGCRQYFKYLISAIYRSAKLYTRYWLIYSNMVLNIKQRNERQRQKKREVARGTEIKRERQRQKKTKRER